MPSHVYVSRFSMLYRLTAAQWERYLRDVIAGRECSDLVVVRGTFCGRVHDVTAYEPQHAAAGLELIGAPPEPPITDAEITAALAMPDCTPSLKFECAVALGDPRLARSYSKPERVRSAREQVRVWLLASRGVAT